MTRRLRLAVDIGGTFVDAMELDATTRSIRFRKASTTPDEPWEGVLDAIRALEAPLAEAGLFIHGTTLGLNAVLERRGAVTGIITNDGMRDIFLIGRGNVPPAHMYDFRYEKPPGLVKRRHTAGVRGRLDYRGERSRRSTRTACARPHGSSSTSRACETIAMCFLHSFRDPAHEQRAAAIVREAHPHVSVSVSTEHRARVPRVRAHGDHGARRVHPADLRALRRPARARACRTGASPVAS